jgi:hypothetical protein
MFRLRLNMSGTCPGRSRHYPAYMILALLVAGSVLGLAGAAWWMVRRGRVPAADRAGRRAERQYHAARARQEAGQRAEAMHPDFIRDWMR